VVVADIVEVDEQPTVWLKREQAAKRYNVSTRTLDKLTREEGFPVYRKGRLVRFPQRACDEWVEARRAPEPRINPPILGLPTNRRRRS